MIFNLITINQKMPNWVNAGFTEYQKRFTKPMRLTLIELPLEKRSLPVATIKKQETEKLLSRTQSTDKIIVLDERGTAFNTMQLAEHITQWQRNSATLHFLIGGPDGLDLSQLKSMPHWSLSPLTLPHALVRIIVAEQLYRALMIQRGHPYHRAST